MAYILLDKKIEMSVCIFEKENRLGGKIYDHFFTEASDIYVGQFSVERKKLILWIVAFVFINKGQWVKSETLMI